MRSLRWVAALGLGLVPLLGSGAAGTVPAFAGGGAGMALTATMEGQDQRLLVGTRHAVTITVADTPGESDLRNIRVELDDLDPHPLPVTCPAGVNGQLALEPEQSLTCFATVTAEVGYRTLRARATGRVPGGGTLVRSVPVHYTGFLPPPPPPPAPPAPVVHKVMTPEPAAARPHQSVLAPPARGGEAADPPADPPAVDPLDPPAVADPPADPRGDLPRPTAKTKAGGGCAGGKTAGCCADSTAGSGTGTGCCDSRSSGCAQPMLATTGAPHKNGGLAFTGMSAPMLATAALLGLALIAGGALLVRRVARR